jgi:hypothetical protein
MTQISELRKTLDNPEAKALSDKYSEIQKELDAIKACLRKLETSVRVLRSSTRRRVPESTSFSRRAI